MSIVQNILFLENQSSHVIKKNKQREQHNTEVVDTN